MANNLDNQAVLRRVGKVLGEQEPVCPNSILLNPSKTTTVGRTGASNVRLLSSKTPLMISRKHASITFEGGRWTVVDHSSLNGVFVNGCKITPGTQQQIKAGDHICFGVAYENNVHEFEYLFEMAPCMRKRKVESRDDPEDESRAPKILKESDKNLKNCENTPGPSGESLKENAGTMRCKIQESEKKIEGLKLLLVEKEQEYQNEMKQKEKHLVEQLLQQKGELEKEKEEQEKYLMGLLQGKLRDKERDLSDQLEKQKTILLAEKEKVESDLMKEMDRKIEEKDKELMMQLKAQKERLENILQLKVDEQIHLQEELDKHKVESEKLQGLQENEKKLEENLQILREELLEKQKLLAKQEDITRKAEDMAKRQLMEQMEDEFTCIICQELFIEASTLTCSHSFCDYCLKLWLKKKKTCPICRTSITGTFVRSRVLDSAIAKMVETMDDETKMRRQTVFRERKKLEPELAIIKDSPPEVRRITPLPGNQGNPIVVRPGNQDNNDVQILDRRVPPAFLRFPRVRLHPVGGQPEVQATAGLRRRYQGNGVNQFRGQANGHCFNCGMRGHWSRTCPFRQ